MPFRPKGGESWDDVGERAQKFIKSTIVDHLKSTKSKKSHRILLVSHGGYIRQFFRGAHLLAGKEWDFRKQVSLKNTALSKIRISRDVKGNLKFEDLLFGCIKHLD